jgi:hypothetical protein
MKRSTMCLVGALAGTALGCGVEEGVEEGEQAVTTENGEIVNGDLVSSDTWGSPSWGCSSTILGNRWLLTAKHCNPSVGVTAFLTNDRSTTVTFQNPIFVHPSLDVTMVRLSGQLTPAGTVASRGPYSLYRGSEAQLVNTSMYCQGWGINQCNGGTCTGDGNLHSENTTITVVNTGLPGFCDGSAGCFRTSHTATQHVGAGDSGGGCMRKSAINSSLNRVVGTISGNSTTEDFFVSVPWFRDWANGIIGSAPTFGAVTGFESNDLTNAVFYVNASSHLIDLSRSTAGTWSRTDLTTQAAAPNAASNPTAFIRWDGSASIAFRSGDNHVQEIALPHGGGLIKRDLTATTGAPAAAGNPASYGRPDRIGIVMYRGTSGQVEELSLDPSGTWFANDLAAVTGAPTAATDPVGYVRADTTSSVVYRSGDNHIRELTLPMGGFWGAFDMTALFSLPAATGQPRPYTRPDGVSVVLFRGQSDNHVYELALTGGTWVLTDLTSVTGSGASLSDPFGYVRADGVAAVVFKTASDLHIRELTLSGGTWSKADLTALAGAPSAGGLGMSAYVRSDRFSAVTYRTSDNHLHELRRAIDGTSWTDTDLTNAVGGTI